MKRARLPNGWESSAVAVSVMTRQRRRAAKREKCWAGMSEENILRGECGFIPRRIRRSMAMDLAKR